MIMKKAVLVVSFGVSNQETRERTIAACERKIKQSLSEYDVYQAYTSIRIIEKIKKREKIKIDHPVEALKKIYESGYKEVLIQPLYLVCGEEFKKLQRQVESYRHHFRVLILSQPLLQGPDDFLPVAKAIKKQLPVQTSGEAIVLMGHGTSSESQIVYPMLDTVLRANGVNAFVGTLKGEPGIETLMKRLKEQQVKMVILAPLLLATGYHVKRDMIADQDTSWKNQLEKHGFKVQVFLQGLGENPEIQHRFVNLISRYINGEQTH